MAIDGFKKALVNPQTRAVVCVLDATRLERSLYLLLQLCEVAKKVHCPVVAVVNVMDEVIGKGVNVDLKGLQKEMGCYVLGTSAKKGEGLSELKKLLSEFPARALSNVLEKDLINLEDLNSKDQILSLKIKANELSKKYGPKEDVLLLSQHRIDNFFLSTWGGPVVFTLLMLFLFQAIFSWAAPFMDAIDGTIAATGDWVASHVSNVTLSDFLKDAIFAGLGSFLVFAPQIFILF